MRFIHDRIFPVLCHVCKGEDKDLFMCANYLHQTGFAADQLGLPEDFCVPLTAAVRKISKFAEEEINIKFVLQIVEMSSLDMCTTPLDRLTCLYDAVSQIKVNIS